MINKSIVSFSNKNEQNLIGLLETGNGKTDNSTVVLMLNPGLKSRVAPHRLYVKISDLLVKKGLSTFRFDAHGIGDSEGEIEGNLKEVLHDQVLSGALVDDVLASIDHLREEYLYRKFVLLGLCGGAMTALQAGSFAHNVEAVMMLGLPVVFVGQKDKDFVENLDKEYAEHILLLYLKKIFNLNAWKRFLTFNSEYKLIWKIMVLKVKGFFKNNNQPLPTEVSQHPKINTVMLERYPELCTQVKKQLYVFAETEGNRYQFDQEVKNYFTRLSEKQDSKFDVVLIPNSNHEYSILDSQPILFEELDKWVITNLAN